MTLNNIYRFYIDVSGTILHDDIFIGTILFNERFRKKFIQEFNAEFPNLTSFKNKGTTLRRDKLKEIIDFMNDKRIPMCCSATTKNIQLSSIQLMETKFKALLKKNPIMSHKKERMMGVLYYYALKPNAYPRYVYEGQMCMETQMKIDKAMSKLSSISQRDKYQFYLSPNWRRHQHLLKFADFVASAGRRLPKTFLAEKSYFKFNEPEIVERDLDHVFGYNKLKADIIKAKKRRILRK